MDHIQYAYSQSFAQKGVCLIYIRVAFLNIQKREVSGFLGILKEDKQRISLPILPG